MEFRDPPDLARFRADVRDFISHNLPPDPLAGQAPDAMSDNVDAGAYSAEAMQRTHRFQRALAERKWLTLAWPTEHGGLGASFWQQLVMNEEIAYHRAPGAGLNMGVMWVGPALMLYGTDAQKQRHMQAIAAAESWWCTLYSEPGAGSDLAAMQTRAVADGDDYVINGQKIWTSGAHRSDWGWLAARTDPDAPKHKGLTMFMVEMDTPGVTVRPLVDMADGRSFNEVFFEDVRVPKANVVGDVNRGWYHMAVALDYERSGISVFARGRRTIEEIRDFLRDHPADQQRHPGIRYELADRAVEVAVGTHLAHRITHMQTQGVIANHEASVSRLFGSELTQRIAGTGLKAVGLYGGLGGRVGSAGPPSQAPLGGHLARDYLMSVSATIAAGTSEIQRGIIATRGLGLPRL